MTTVVMIVVVMMMMMAMMVTIMTMITMIPIVEYQKIKHNTRITYHALDHRIQEEAVRICSLRCDQDELRDVGQVSQMRHQRHIC